MFASRIGAIGNLATEGQAMRVNDEAVSFAAFSLAKVLAAELIRKGMLDRQELIAAISLEIEGQQRVAEPTNEDAAVLLTAYCDEVRNC